MVMTRKSLYDYCIEQNLQALLTQWDTERNGNLSVHKVTSGSHKSVWWRCDKGHRWEVPIYSRTINHSGCPYCANRKLPADAPTLQREYPNIAAEWHSHLNGELTPNDVAPHTHRKVWWICEHGHIWRAQVNSRVRNRGCPYCSNRRIVIGENDLGTTHPMLASQWNYDRNVAITPQTVVAGNHAKVWWRCERGHEWQASILSRSKGSGCPVCAGKRVIAGENDLASAYPDIAAQWHPILNGKLAPTNVTPYSNRSVWWVCEMGHEYRASINHRTQMRSACPYCTGRKVLPGFNDLATKEPLLSKQWCQELNGALTPQMVTVSSHKKVWWQCSDGHVWKAIIASRTGARRHGCPICAGKVKINQRC